MSGNISLTKIMFAALVSTFAIATLFGLYLDFISINGVTIDEPYNSAFKNISAQYDSFAGISGEASDQGLVKNILNFGSNLVTGTVNVFVMGLDAIGKFFEMIPIIGNILSAISQVFPPLSGLIGLLTIVITLYIAMRYIQSASNKIDLP